MFGKKPKKKRKDQKNSRMSSRVIPISQQVDEQMKEEKKSWNTDFTDEQKKTIAAVVTRIMAERNLNQTELGNLLGVTQTTISNWKKGIGGTRENIDKLCKLDGTTYAQLFGEVVTNPELESALTAWVRGQYPPLVEKAAEAVLRDHAQQGVHRTRDDWHAAMVRICNTLRDLYAGMAP